MGRSDGGASALQGRARIAAMALATAAIALDSILLGLIVPLLPEVKARTGAGELGIGFAMAAYGIPIVIFALPLGALADRLGRRPLLVCGLLLTAVGSVVILASEALTPLIAGRAIQGLGSASSWIAGLALVSDLARVGRRGQTIGFALAANSGGAIFGPALGGILGGAFGFAAPFLIVAVAACAIGGLAALVLPGGRPSREPRARRNLLATLRGRDALAAVAVTMGGATAIGMIDVISPLDLDERFGVSPLAIGLIFAAAIAFDSIAAPPAGRASDQLGRRPVAILGLIVLAGSAALLAMLAGVAGAVVGLCVFGVGVGVAFAAALPWLDDCFGELDRGRAYGVVNLVYAAGYAGGPLLAGVLYELGGAVLAYWIMAGLAAAGAIAVTAGGRAASASRPTAASERPG
jgi:MFS family permease